jgi:putative addiction module component (TIGR02574 family)
MQAEFEHLRQLPIAEKLQLVEALWEDILTSGEPFPFHVWDLEEAHRRAAELDADPSIAITREEVWKRVDEGRG